MTFNYTYEELLERAYKLLPEKVKSDVRFEIPKVKGHYEGNKTVITNLHEIAKLLNRDLNHLVKFLVKELGAPANIEENRVIFNRKLSPSQINSKIQSYAKEFVICHECGKPDTKIIKEERTYFLVCMACGAKRPIIYKIK
ncbi:MAG TPA: translation initiation factor IF-2 subunit beta [Nautiliaceae bacterium]|nr:translation initiation factor IF-2 subunit beta [Nautiliaceae bacterium]